jgi:hypothetical protein
MVLETRGPRGADALERFKSALGGATVSHVDAEGVFEVLVAADSLDSAVERVRGAVAAAGADDHLRFAEHPDLPRHWQRRGYPEAPPSTGPQS